MSILHLLKERHGIDLPDSKLQKIVDTCAEIIIVQDQEEYYDKAREAIDSAGGCSFCGDLSGFNCVCEEDDDDYCILCRDKRYGRGIGGHCLGCNDKGF